MSNNSKCNTCASTGVIRATLVKREENGLRYQDHIDVVLCGSPLHDVSLGQDTMATMEENTGLPVVIVGVQQPS